MSLYIQTSTASSMVCAHLEFASNQGAYLQWFASPVYTRFDTMRLWQKGKFHEHFVCIFLYSVLLSGRTHAPATAIEGWLS